MFFGDELLVDDAHRLGLVNVVVPADKLVETAASWAGRLAASPTRTISLTKWLVNRSLDSDRAGSFYDESYAQELNMQTEDAQEGVAAFVERRDPKFKGW
jgi:2-(1,2-epoxy-1,2-dihydrophenyl)acetyl-CoA isomerase